MGAAMQACFLSRYLTERVCGVMYNGVRVLKEESLISRVSFDGLGDNPNVSGRLQLGNVSCGGYLRYGPWHLMVTSKAIVAHSHD
jgi:hypothetical protein